jgi:hypothetical protein
VGAPVRHEYVGIFNQLTYSQAEVIGQDVMNFFRSRARERRDLGVHGI